MSLIAYIFSNFKFLKAFSAINVIGLFDKSNIFKDSLKNSNKYFGIIRNLFPAKFKCLKLASEALFKFEPSSI